MVDPGRHFVSLRHCWELIPECHLIFCLSAKPKSAQPSASPSEAYSGLQENLRNHSG